MLEHREDDTVWFTIRSLLGTRGGIHRLGAPRAAPQASRAHPRASSAPCIPRAACSRWAPPCRSASPPRSTASCPPSASIGAAERAFGVYLHVPFCRVRCGYCDFNTYTAGELRGARQVDYADHAIARDRMSRRRARGIRRADRDRPRPSSSAAARRRCCPPATSCACSAAFATTFGLAPGAEVTTEANPDSVDRRRPAASSRTAGFTRVSFGMQSAVPHVLAALDRTHDPERVPHVVGWARDAGLDVSLDLIYGTPGESLADWRRIARRGDRRSEPDHISARTRSSSRTARSSPGRSAAARSPTPDDDLQADMYELADELLGGRRVTTGTR